MPSCAESIQPSKAMYSCHVPEHCIDARRDATLDRYRADLVSAVANKPAGADPSFDQWVRESTSKDGINFAKQSLVLVGTLVTSISSF